MRNFNHPYCSRSIAEFWKRWHISYLLGLGLFYIPLGGRRVAVPRWYFNLFFTFLVSGLWHGANWTYVIWGALNGFYIIFEYATFNFWKNLVKKIALDRFPKFYNAVCVSLTFSLVCFA